MVSLQLLSNKRDLCACRDLPAGGCAEDPQPGPGADQQERCPRPPASRRAFLHRHPGLTPRLHVVRIQVLAQGYSILT